MSEFFSCPRAYIQSATTIQDKICRLDALITALMDAADAAALGEDISEYSLDDGQTKIRETGRSVGEITKSIEDAERLRQMYIGRLNGRIIVLKDKNSLIGAGTNEFG